MKLVRDYTGMMFVEIQEIDIDEYLYLQREAFIWNKSQSEKGREYLRNAWMLTQSNPDRGKLREKFGGGR